MARNRRSSLQSRPVCQATGTFLKLFSGGEISIALLSKPVVLEYGVDCPDAILPMDFFSFRVSASVVRDTDFEYPHSQLADFSGYLWIYSETIFLNRDLINDLTSKNFIAGLHVRQIDIRHHVGKQRYPFVHHHVPEVYDAVGSATHES